MFKRMYEGRTRSRCFEFDSAEHLICGGRGRDDAILLRRLSRKSIAMSYGIDWGVRPVRPFNFSPSQLCSRYRVFYRAPGEFSKALLLFSREQAHE